MKKLLSLLLILSLVALVSCEDAAVDEQTEDPNVESPVEPDDPTEDPEDPEDPQEEDSNDGIYSIAGAIQKGPFVQGSSITISELDDELNPTGINYQTTTTDDTGSFEIGSKINSRYVEITAKGYYYDEVAGEISSSELTLYTISDLEAGGQVNVNLLTSLANAKVKSLITSGGEDYTFDQAILEAEESVLSIFGLENNELHFDKMDITEQGDANAMLLAISITLQSDRSVGEMSELIAKIGSEIESSGGLESQTLKDAIQQGAVGIDLGQVRENLTNRYNDLGVSCVIPDFENFIDSDGNGKIDSQEAWLLVKGEKSYPIDSTKQSIDVEIEKNISYQIQVIYSDDESDWISYSSSPTSRADIEYETITFTASQHEGYNSRTASVIFSNPDDDEQQSVITIDQSPEGALVLGKSSYDVAAAGEVVEISFETNTGEYNIEVEADAQEWITFTPTSKSVAMDEYKVSFTILKNTLSTSRSGRIVITSGDNTDYVTINQDTMPVLYFDQEIISCDWNSQTVQFTVTHNCDYTIDWDSTASGWEKWSYAVVSQSNDTDVYSITMTRLVLIGWYGDYRSANITITAVEDSSVVDTLFVEQWPYPLFELSGDNESDINITKEAQELEYKVSCNVDIVEIVMDSWITLKSSDTSNDPTTYVFSIEANSGFTRTGTITLRTGFENLSGNIAELVLSITQVGEIQETLEVNCPVAGTLSEYVSELQMLAATELILTGTVNADDFSNVINLMSQLEVLDLSGARFENDEMTAYILKTNRGSEAPALREIKLPTDYDTQVVANSFSSGYPAYVCDYITDIDFGGTTTLPSMICYGFDKLERVYIPNVKGALEYALFYESSLKEIDIPYGVTSIENGAFIYCDKLERVTLPESLTAIGGSYTSSATGAFGYCSSLKSLEIPASVTGIYGQAFKGCSSLSSMTFAQGSKLETLYVNSGSYDGISGKTTIYSMFEGTTSLKSITIPASVENIQGPVFYYSSLEEFTFESGSNLTTLEGGYVRATSNTGLSSWISGNAGCFEGSPFTSIEVPTSLRTLGQYAFKGTAVKVFDLPNIYGIATGVFLNSAAEVINLPEITDIPTLSFAGTPYLTTLYTPQATSLGTYALSESGYVSGDVVIDAYTYIGEGAFIACSATSISLPNATELGDYIFQDCTNLTSVSLPKLETVGSTIFDGCTALDYESLVFDGFTTIPRIFEYDTRLTTVSQSMFPNATTIASWAFRECPNLTTLNLDKIETIEYDVFSGCSSLVDVYMPNLSSVGDFSFYDCTSLKSFDCAKLTKVYNLFVRCTSLSEFTNVDNVEHLEPNLGDCTSFKETSGWDSLIYANLYGADALQSFSSTSANLETFSAGSCYKLKTLSFTKATNIGIYFLEHSTLLDSIEVGTEATSEITNLYIENIIPYPRAATLTIGQYAADANFTIDGNTITFNDGNSITFKEIVVVNNL